MDERQYNNIVGIIRDNEAIEKLEFKLSLLQIFKLSLAAIMVKGGHEGFKTLYNNTEKQLKKLLGILETEDKFVYKGGRRKLNKF